MKKLSSFTLLALMSLIIAAAAFAADPVATAAAAPAAQVSILDWFKQNSAAIFGALFAISEVLGAVPGFKGNGVFDTVVKALAILSNKQVPPPEVV